MNTFLSAALNHVYSGEKAFSIATVGCNFSCSFCQNHDLSQCTKDLKQRLGAGDGKTLGVRVNDLGMDLSPEEVVRHAKMCGCSVIAYTYNEPTIFLEYALDCARLAHEQGMINIFKSNGYETKETVERMTGLIDAINIDLKSFSDEFYRRNSKARLQPVLDTIRNCFEAGIWTEVTTLIIPGENDSDDELRACAQYLVSVSPTIPWHVTAFYPMYKMTDKSPTPLSTLERAYRIGKEQGLQFVYSGADEHSCTFCPSCGTMLVKRKGLFSSKIVDKHFKGGLCLKCNAAIPGLWRK